MKCKRCDQKFITQNFRHVRGYHIYEENETVKTMSKGGYIWIYFGFC